ncbi:MAG TPA: magnesium transporter [Gemmatimonadaceae bacterium]|nr:magnesium transporter [Gemmatimonadaceae bacterium]
MSRDRLVRHLAEAALRRHPGETARQLERMRGRDVADLLERQDAGLAADALRNMRADKATEVVELLNEPHASRILSALEPAQATTLLARLDETARRARLDALGPALARELGELLTYPPGVAGAVMDPRVTTLRPDATAREALSHIRALRNKSIHDVFIVDEQGRLTGSVGIQDLALAEPGVRIEELAQTAPPHVQAFAPQEELVAIAEERRLTSLPVVDVTNRLLGVVRYADLLTATQRDATADIQTMVGASREERALSNAWFAVRKRLPWLQINLGTAFLAAAVVGLFEDTIARVTALAVLLPVVAGQSGNAGAQALAVAMRGLALREVSVRHWFRVGRKELAVGAINGVAVALVTGLAVYVWSRSVGLAAVIAVAMVCSMVIAGVAGASVPMALTLLRQDPAASSSIVLTTITDVAGFLTFLGFATLASGLL